MAYKLEEIKGLDEASAAALRAHGVANSDDVLGKVRTPRDRAALAEATGILPAMILHMANRADLMRVKGIGMQYGDLLEASGVDTCPELAQRNAANLTQKMAEVNAEKSLVRALPTESHVTDWIAQAKELGRVLEY